MINSICISAIFLRFKSEGDPSSSLAFGLVSIALISESIIGILALPSWFIASSLFYVIFRVFLFLALDTGVTTADENLLLPPQPNLLLLLPIELFSSS